MTASAERVHALKAATEQARRRWAAVDATFETIERDSDLGGAMLAGALAYRLFLFALPLAFFFVAGANLLAEAFGIKPNVIPNSVGFAGVVTKQVASASSGSSNWWVTLTAFAVLAYATRVLFRAVSILHALAWERSAASIRLRARALFFFGPAVVGQVALGAAVGALNHRSPLGGLIAVAVYVFAVAGLWLIVSLHVPHASARWTELVPGCLFYGVGASVIAAFNILILGRLIESKSSTYGALGVAATLLLGFFFVGRIMVVAAVVNATIHDRRLRSASNG